MKQRKPMFSLDVLALALLTCLLASVVGMLVMGEDSKAGQWPKLLHERTQQITNGASETQAAHQEIAWQVAQRAELLRLERAQRIAQSEADELKRNIEARTKIADAETEVASLRDDLAKLKYEADVTPGRRQIVGNYRGPYILIECLKGHALVYPGKTRLAKNPDKNDLDQLVDRITQAGFVVFVVRPGGWFADSYDSLHNAVYPRLAQYESASRKTIGRSTFPLDSSEAIASYLPAEPNRAPEMAPPPTPKPRRPPASAIPSRKGAKS